MKKLILGALSVILLFACDQKQRYTQNSPEIDSVKKLIANYNAKTYDTSIYADTSQTRYNSKENAMSPDETIAYHKQTDEAYTSRGFLEEDQEYEMVVTDDGETWVNCWLDWQGTLAGTNKKIDIPIHLTYRFADGKIVREVGMWDPTEVVLAMQEMEAMNNMSADEKAIKTSIDNITKAWNSFDKNLMDANLTSNFKRAENGNTIVNNPKEYTDFMAIYHGAFPDFTVKIDKTIIDGNTAYLNWTCTGTNTGSFMGNPPTNKKIKTHGFSVWHFDTDGKGIQESAFYDNLVVFNQLGIAPPIQ